MRYVQTVPIALHAWLRYPADFRAGVLAVVRCGGDTDSTGAIAGALIGSGVGRAGLPDDWLARLWEPARSVAWMERLAERLAESMRTGKPQVLLSLSPVTLLGRNGVFLGILLAHGVRRLFPPYSRLHPPGID